MLLMPVHDELVFEVPACDVDTVTETVRRIMTHTAEEVLMGQVPVEIDLTVGDSWGKAA